MKDEGTTKAKSAQYAPDSAGETVRALWAKTDLESMTDRTHPLVCHMIDTAAVGALVWHRVFSDTNREAIAADLGVSVEVARAWTIFLAATHDLGKACLGFQIGRLCARGRISRDEEVVTVEESLRSAGLTIPDWQISPSAHEEISFAALRDALQSRGISKGVRIRLAEVVGGHHGRFLNPKARHDVNLLSEGDRTWEAARADLVAVAAQISGIDGTSPPQKPPNTVTIALLTGLVTVSDWIASNAELFPYVARVDQAFAGDLSRYAETSRNQAEEALQRLGWTGDRPGPGEASSFVELFHQKPRPFQATLETLLPDLQEPGLVMIEAPTGEGKTEAALLVADHWGVERGHRGLYFALPTRATSDGIAERLLPYLQARYPGELVGAQILHGRAALAKSLDKARRLADQVWAAPTGLSDDEGGVIAGRWFSYRRRGLLAPFGVGTVDQALLASIGVHHSYVLMAGLASKTVIFDEVHAYDAVMNVRFETLLAWLGAIGGSAVILSATLPDRMRRRFVTAYASGAGWDQNETPGHAVPYPRITAATRTGVSAFHVEASPRRRPEVALNWIGPDDVDNIVAERLAAGDCVAVLCHSVNDAQKTYRRLRDQHSGLADDGQPLVDIFHARFLEADKEDHRQRVVARFGPGHDAAGRAIRNTARPRGAVLVATSIIEQSLDLDFDALISPLAPVDLLIQRLGRVWRHDFNERTGGSDGRPMIWLTHTLGSDNLPAFPRWETLMYSRHRLLRTWWALGGRAGFSDVAEVEALVEAVYADDNEPAAIALRARIDAAGRSVWANTAADEERQRSAQRSGALRGSIPLPREGDLSALTGQDGEEHDALDPEVDGESDANLDTRDGDQSVTLVCLYGSPRAPFLDPAGRDPAFVAADPTAHPSAEEVRRLLARSVPVRHRISAEDRSLPGWARNSVLRGCWAVFLSPDGRGQIDDLSLALDAEVGLKIVRRSRESNGPTSAAQPRGGEN